MKIKIVKVSTKKPPKWILKAVKKNWGVEWESPAIFTYGGLIRTSIGVIPEDYFIHETHHLKQQEEHGGTNKWWKKYLKDDKFRYEQELECYRKQYQWLGKHVKNRATRFELLKHYARSLSGDMYGNLVTFSKAINDIKS